MQESIALPFRLRVRGAWRWLRLASLPIALVIALIAALSQKEWIFSRLESAFGLGFAELPIKLYSTMVERAIVAGAWAGLLAAAIVCAYSFAAPRWRYASAVLLTAIASLAAGIVLDLPLWMIVALALILALNAVPEEALGRVFHHRFGAKASAIALGGGLAVAETMLPRPFWMWLTGHGTAKRDESRQTTAALLSWAPGIVVATAVFGLSLPYSKLVKLGWMLNRSDEVQHVYGENVTLFSPYDIAAIPFDPKARRIYMCGNGLAEVLVLSADAPDLPPANTDIATGGAEFCILDPVDRSFIVYNRDEDALLVWDLDDWRLRTSIPMGLQASGGAVFLSKQDGSPAVVAASEISGDGQGANLRVIDLATGATLGASPIVAGHMIVHPTQQRAYVDFYTRETGIQQLELPSLKELARVPADQRNDRMAVDLLRGNLLVASPLRGRVLVYDTNGLAPKAPIPSTFGVRSVAVDHSRDLLLTASLVSNQVDVIDLTTNRRLKRLRVGPWLRNLTLDETCGRAFVASRHGLYWVKYAEPLSACTATSL